MWRGKLFMSWFCGRRKKSQSFLFPYFFFFLPLSPRNYQPLPEDLDAIRAVPSHLRYNRDHSVNSCEPSEEEMTRKVALLVPRPIPWTKIMRGLKQTFIVFVVVVCLNYEAAAQDDQ